MRRTRSPNNTGSLPAITGSETPGYYTEGPPATVVSAADLNIIQEELVAVATMKGASLDATGADRAQCKTAVDAVLGVEALAAEAAAVDTVRKLVVIASNDAEVGETDNGVTCAAVVASDTSSAKGMQTLAAASFEARAGKADGTTLRAAVIGCDYGIAEGDSSVVVGGQFSSTPDPGATGRSSGLFACEGDGTAEVSGQNSAAMAAFDPVVSGSISAAIACDTGVVSGGTSAVVGGQGHTVSGDKSLALGSGGSTVSGDESAALAAGLTTVSGTRAVAAASLSCEVTQNQGAAIGCTSSKNKSNAHSVMLASKYCDSSASTVPPEGSVYGGWDPTGSPSVEPSWRLESNGGHVRGAGTVASGGLDYAEWFPNADDAEHAPGLLIARSGRAARAARSGDRILGVVSTTPTVVGGDDSLAWASKWQRDEWGRLLKRDDGGNVLNPNFDPARAAHTPRALRPDEWTCVGLLGQLRVRVDATVAPDDEVVAGEAGIGTRGTWVGRGAQLECMEIVSPFDAARGYAIALCLLR